jgi:hypothetical protein
MTSIRIAIAAALAAATVLAGGTASAGHSTQATSHAVALAAAPRSNSPVLCCD